MADTITIHTLWGLRRGFEDQVPELMVAWDEYCLDNYPEGYEDEKRKAVESWGDDLVDQREIAIRLPLDQVENAFRSPTIDGSITD